MKFTAGDKTFDIKITIGAVKRVKTSKGIDLLLGDAQAKELIDVLSDPMTVAEIIAALLEPQFDALGIDSEEQVLELFDGEALQRANDIFYEELKNFFKGLHRPGVVLAIEKMRNTLKLAQKTILEKMENFDEKQAFLSGVESTKQRE